MTLAIFGGTFNPVHVGHLFLAEEVRTRLHYDRILFIPVNIPVHKKMESPIYPDHRLKMLKLATAPYPEFLVDDCELRRGGESYTIETIQKVIQKYSIRSKPGLIIGDDLAKDFHTWKQADLLANMSDLIIAHRKYRKRVRIDFPYVYIENELLPVCSSEIRERIYSNKSIRFLVPDEVIRYIIKNRLYL